MDQRIAFVETKSSVYGGQKALLARCKELDRLGTNYYIIHPFSESEFLKQARSLGVSGNIIRPAYKCANWTRVVQCLFITYQLLKLSRNRTVDIIHTDAFDSAYIVGALRMLGVGKHMRTVFTIRSERYLRFNWIDRFLVRRLDRLCTNSHYSQRAIARASGIDTRRILVTYTPIDFTALLTKPAYRNYSFSRSSITLGYMGSLEPRKRLDRFIAFGERLALQSDFPDVRLHVYGTPKQAHASEVRSASVDLATPNSCSFHGYKTPSEAAAQVDILFCPFEHEPLGRVVAEFLYMGIPVIAMDCGGLREAGCGYAWMLDATTEDKLYQQFEEAVRTILHNGRFDDERLGLMRSALTNRFGASEVVKRELASYR